MEGLDEVGNSNEPDFKFAKNYREHPRSKWYNFKANENIADAISSHDRGIKRKNPPFGRS